ncbi:hypothetical protein JOQ06_017953, partial [Pogonophryne albipinna]
AYRDHQNAYAKSLRDTWSKFYSAIINNSPGNSKLLFSTINHLLKPQTPLHKDTTEEQCDNFITFFRKKVETIRSLLSNSAALLVLTVNPQPGPTQPLCCFTNISQHEACEFETQAHAVSFLCGPSYPT